MEKERRSDGDNNREMDFLYGRILGSSSPSRSLPISSPPSDAVAAGLNGGPNYIVHTVTKFDTLAGIAIKYGVEVSDIKRLNGLVTDLQMFALKTLQIPLPGKHPPSPSLCNGDETPPRPSSSEQTQSNRRHSDLFDSFQSLKLTSSEKVSPAMSSLQGFYGLQQTDKRSSAECYESVYRNRGAKYLEDGFSANCNSPLSHHRKSKSVANGLMYSNGLQDPLLSKESDYSSSNGKGSEKLLRRRQKSEADFSSFPPEKLLKEENTNVSAISSRGLALRPKSTTRIAVDGEVGGQSPFPLSLGDPLLTDSLNGVRKSSSTPSLQDSESGALSSLWNLKPDFQALSSAAIPIFDGLPKPVNRRNKAALD